MVSRFELDESPADEASWLGVRLVWLSDLFGYPRVKFDFLFFKSIPILNTSVSVGDTLLLSLISNFT